MSAQFPHFEPRIGGGYRMVLSYAEQPGGPLGKSAPGEDEVEVEFLEMLPDAQVIGAVTFVRNDPAFAGTMTMTILIEPMREGTKVTLRADNVPAGILAEDYRTGMLSSLQKLARLTESPPAPGSPGTRTRASTVITNHRWLCL